MSATTISHWLDVSEQIGQSCNQFLAETPLEINSAFEQVSQRLQAALTAFTFDPLNPAKARSLNLAINNYENALEMALFKACSVIEQAQEMGVDLDCLPAPTLSIIQSLLAHSSNKFNH